MIKRIFEDHYIHGLTDSAEYSRRLNKITNKLGRLTVEQGNEMLADLPCEYNVNEDGTIDISDGTLYPAEYKLINKIIEGMIR